MSRAEIAAVYRDFVRQGLSPDEIMAGVHAYMMQVTLRPRTPSRIDEGKKKSSPLGSLCDDVGDALSPLLRPPTSSRELVPTFETNVGLSDEPTLISSARNSHEENMDTTSSAFTFATFRKGQAYDVIYTNVNAGKGGPKTQESWLWVPASDSNGNAICNRIALLAKVYYGNCYLTDFRSSDKKLFKKLVLALRREFKNPPDVQFDDEWVGLKLKGIMRNKRYKWRKAYAIGQTRPTDCPKVVWKAIKEESKRDTSKWDYLKANRKKGVLAGTSSKTGRGGIGTIMTDFWYVVGRMPNTEEIKYARIHGLQRLYDEIEKKEGSQLNRFARKWKE